jgi:hypothetical protein
MLTITGYDYTLAGTTEDLEVKTSLSCLTSSLDEFSNEELSMALIKSAIIYGENPVGFVNEMIKNKEYEELNQLINSTLIARRAVTHALIMNCHTTNEELVSKSRDRKTILKRLKRFKQYEDELKVNKSKALVKENSSSN